MVGDLTGAQRVATRTLRKAEERGRAAEILNARAVRALCACFRGDWVELDEEWSLAAPLLAEVRGALRIGLLLWARRRADLWLGRPFPQARSPAEIYAGMPSAALAVEASGCLIAVEHGSVNAGVRAGALSEVMPRTGRGLNWFIAVQALCASFGHLGDAEEAERWAVALSPFRDCFYLGFSRMALGRADALNGRWEQSIGHFDRAVATCRAQGLRPLLALALLERGRVYDLRGARGDAERARLSNEEGRRILEQLGMRGARCVAEVP